MACIPLSKIPISTNSCSIFSSFSTLSLYKKKGNKNTHSDKSDSCGENKSIDGIANPKRACNNRSEKVNQTRNKIIRADGGRPAIFLQIGDKCLALRLI